MASTNYRGALKAASITGASHVIVLLLRLLKVKAIAVILGPAGVGLFGILASVMDIMSAFVSSGLNNSAVRRVAETSASGDTARVARVVWTLRRVSILFGAVLAAALALLASPVAVLSLGSVEHASAIAVLALAVALTAVYSGQTALLRGLRKIRELAKLNILGAFFGTLLSVPLVWICGVDGIAPAMVVAAALSLIASWWYVRRIQIPSVRMTVSAVVVELRSLLGFGLVIFLGALLDALVRYGTRSILAHNSADLGVVGQFQAAATLSMVYLPIISQAVGQDFFPHLAGIAKDKTATARLVNEQSEIMMLLAGPAMLAVVALGPWLIELLYSRDFFPAVEVLRWQSLGVLLRMAVIPMDLALLVQGRGYLFVGMQIGITAVHLGGFWALVELAGLRGAGFALGAALLVYLPILYLVLRRVSGFAWSRGTVTVLAFMSVAYGLAMSCIHLLPETLGSGAAMAIAVVISVYSYRRLAHLTATPLAQRALDKVGRLLPRKRTRS